MIVGIDPSFTGTGIVVCKDDGSLIESHRFTSHEPVFTSIASAQRGADKVSVFLKDIITKYCYFEDVDVVIEYPAFATSSGAFLGILNGWLGKLLHDDVKVRSVCWIPPIACNTYIHLKSTKKKTEDKKALVEYVIKNYGVPKMSHDEASALIFVHIFIDIINGAYTKTFCWTKPYGDMEDNISKKQKRKTAKKEVTKAKKKSKTKGE